MKKILPSMMLSFTLYSADQNTSSKDLQFASTMMSVVERLQPTHIRRKKGFVTSDVGLVRENVAFLRPIVGAIVAGYVLLEDVNTRDILLGAALCGLAVQQIQIFGLVNALKQNKCERDALKQEQGRLKQEQGRLKQDLSTCCNTKTRRLNQQDQRLDRLEGLPFQTAQARGLQIMAELSRARS